MVASRVAVVLGVSVLTACGQAGVLSRLRPTSAPVAVAAATDSVAAVALPVAAVPAAPDLIDATADTAAVVIDSIADPINDEAAADTTPLPPAWDIEVGSYETNARVEYFVDRFRGPVKASFELALARQSRYAPMIHQRLRAGGLPEDMIFLPLIESWYDPHAYSVAAAVGMWQFMTSTARGVGLRVDWWVDERRDPVRATDGAVIYLNELRSNFGSTYLAAAAYNGGPGRVSRGLTRHAESLEGTNGDDLFFALSDARALHPETRDYVPKLIAAALVGKDPVRYGVEARQLRPFEWDSVSVPPGTSLPAVAKALDVPLDTVLDYNPQILRGMTPPAGAPVWLRVPVGVADGFAESLAEIPEVERHGAKRIVTKDGDFITRIARANGLTAKQLNWYNPQATRLPNGNLHAGQRILVPRREVVRAARDVPNPTIERYGVSRTYVVRRGDNLWTIARRQGTTVAALKRLNRLSSDNIRVGQRLRVR